MCGAKNGRFVLVFPDTLPDWLLPFQADPAALADLVEGELVIVWGNRSPMLTAIGCKGRLPDGRLLIDVRRGSPWSQKPPTDPDPPLLANGDLVY